MAQYSGQHKVPTVQEFREIERQREQASLANDSQLPTTDRGEAAPPLPNKDHEGLRQRKPAPPAKSGGTAGDDDDDDDDDDDPPKDSQFQEQSGQAEKERLKQQSKPQGKPTDNFQTKGKR